MNDAFRRTLLPLMSWLIISAIGGGGYQKINPSLPCGRERMIEKNAGMPYSAGKIHFRAVNGRYPIRQKTIGKPLS